MMKGKKIKNIEGSENDLFTEISFTPARDPFLPGLMNDLPTPPKKIILLRASRIGDFINATPAFQSIRSAFPDAKIDILTLPMLGQIADRCPFLDETVIFPGYPGLAEQFFEPKRTLEFFQRMQEREYDLAIQMQGTGVYSNPFMLMLGARWTAGFIRENDPPGRLSAVLPWPDRGHETSRVLALTEFLGIETISKVPEFHLWPEDYISGDQILSQIDPPWIGIHPSARDKTRRWPIKRFISAAAQLQQIYGGTILIFGEERERGELEDAVASVGVMYSNLAGCTTIPETGAILSRLAIFLTNDSGPAHIAYAVGTPTVTIFGGGDPFRNGPLQNMPNRILAYPVSCRPCETGDCPIGYHCLENISVSQVVEAAIEIFQLPEK
jgi:ADP-heptose:LPS heptosyltransferase